MQYLDGKTTVTHIIASNLTPKKIVEFRKYRIVKPAWIVESVNAGRLLPWESYRVVDEGITQKVLHLDGGQVTTQVNNRTRSYRDQTDTSWYTSQLSKVDTFNGSQLPTPIASDPPEKEDDINQDGHPLATTLKEEVVRLEDDDFDTELEEEDPEPAFQLDQLGGVDLETDDHEDVSFHISDGVLTQDLVDLASKDERLPLDGLPQNETTEDRELELGLDTETLHKGVKRKSSFSGSSPEPVAKRTELTAEEHNAILLADPRLRKSSTLNPDFLEQYYRESRLHHLSTWKADLKAQLQALTAEKTASQQARQKRPPGARRYVLHVDFDSFFVAVSLKDCPQFVEQPACVAHGGGSGSEIASCNYPARKFGVKNGMWMKRAQELCQDLKVLPYNFPAYEAASRLFYEAIMATEGIVQSVSIDEALVDVTCLCLPAGGSEGVGVREDSVLREQAKADEIAQHLREHVKEETGCAVSVGIGGNILLAKVALRKAKPAGQYQIKPEEILDFLSGLEVQDLPGVAHSIGGKLEEIGVKFVKDLRDVSREKLTTILGPKTGEKLYNYARGIDRTEVGDQVIRKSVSAEVNWGVRFETNAQAEEFIQSLCGELNRRLVKERVKGKQLTMKIMRRAADAPLDPPKQLGHGKCDTFNKSIVLGVATNATDVLAKEALSILRNYGFSPGELRGLGVQMTKLEPLKSSTGDDSSSSQKRLQFKTAMPTKPAERESEKGIGDPIRDDPETPKKSQVSRVIVAQPLGIGISANSPSRKPLNMLGTQFILPTQVDPEVLAALPPDIRSKLSKYPRPVPDPGVQHLPAQEEHEFKRLVAFTALPNESQLDPEALSALPDELRAEVLAHYATSPTKPRPGQSVLPQSPRKNRTIAIPRTSARGRPRGRGRGGNSLLSRLKGATRLGDTSTLTQANFVATTRAALHDNSATESEGHISDAEIAPDFLAALPEDIRKELVAQHHADQLKRKAGIQIQARKRLQKPKADVTTGTNGQLHRERVWKLPALPTRPSFTVKGLTRMEDLRGAVREWFDEFKREGPYTEDVEAFGRYLADVVGKEADIAKAVAVVKWMDWVVDGGYEGDGGGSEEAEGKWKHAQVVLKRYVREAVEARGLGAVDL